MLALDQYGKAYIIAGKHPRKELMKLLCSSSASKMYTDKKDGSTVHSGYIVKGLWLTLYTPHEVKQVQFSQPSIV